VVARALALALASGLAGAAAAQGNAAPLASQRFDLDRDGAAEQIRVERGGLAVVNGRTGKVAGWKPLLGAAIEAAEIQIASGAEVGGRVVILAVAKSGGRGEALAVEWRRGALHELWRGEVGPQGPDGESTLYIEAGRHGLVRYSGRAGVVRCDGKTAHLHAEKFDFGRGRFRSVDQVPRIPPDAPELVATRAPPAGVPAGAQPIDFRVVAASSQIGAAGPGDLVAPAEIEDGDPATAWVEGRTGFGRGEFVTAKASLDGGLVRAIRLIPGHAASARSFAQHNRLRKAGLLVGRERAFRVVFAQDPARAGAAAEPYWITLPEPVRADCVSLVVIDVFGGQGARSGSGDTAISELAVLTEMDLAPGGAAARLAAAVAAGGREGEQAVRVLVRLGGAAEAALMAEAQKPRASPDSVLRVRRALAELPAGAAELARGLAAPLHPADADRFSRALVAIGATAVEPLGEIVVERAVAAAGRARAAQALSRIADPSAQRVLARAAGSGPREVRRAVAQALGARGDLDALVELAAGAAQESEAREADLWRAVGLLLREHAPGASRTRAMAALAGRLASAEGYELRYRLLQAAGGLDEASLVAKVAGVLSGRAAAATPLERAQGIALRRVAAAALGRSRAPGAAEVLARAARDPDPGVREAAAEALGQSGSASGDEALAGQLAGDGWPRVRRAAAVALGSSCRRPGPAAGLRRAALTDRDVEVRRAALSSLASCGAAGAVRFFLSVAGDRGAPVPVRTLALRLIGGSRDRAAVRPLAELVSAELERASGEEAAIEAAAAGVYALGELGDPSAVPVILRAAEVSLPEIQGAAAAALGRMCPAAGMRRLRALAGSAQHQVAAPARAALRKCRAR
jgi:HEAT repeat protein